MRRSSSFELSCLFGAIALAALSFTCPAEACKCASATVEQGFGEAVAVFEGRVISVDDQPLPAGQGDGAKRVTLALVRTWKGFENRETASVTTGTSSDGCGYAFQPNTSYLVYAVGNETALEVSGCGRTRPMADAGEDLAALGAGITPVEVNPTTVPKPRPAGRPGAVGCGSFKGATRTSVLWMFVPTTTVALGVRRRKRDA